MLDLLLVLLCRALLTLAWVLNVVGALLAGVGWFVERLAVLTAQYAIHLSRKHTAGWLDEQEARRKERINENF